MNNYQFIDANGNKFDVSGDQLTIANGMYSVQFRNDKKVWAVRAYFPLSYALIISLPK